MSHGPTTWRRILGMPLWGTVTIPPLARVDPAGFPEDEFPLQCPKCEYSLRGLREDVCPECGQPFDRGRLLVTQYAERASINTRFRGQCRQLGRLSTAGLVVIVVGYCWPWIPLLLARFLGGTPATMQSALTQIHIGMRVFYVIEMLLLAWMLLVIVRIGRAYRREGGRRRRVLAAIASQQTCASSTPQ